MAIAGDEIFFPGAICYRLSVNKRRNYTINCNANPNANPNPTNPNRRTKMIHYRVVWIVATVIVCIQMVQAIQVLRFHLLELEKVCIIIANYP